MPDGKVEFKSTTPLLRIFDEAKAQEFYRDYLGFQWDWEHRFEPGMPLYSQISQGSCILHLTEHYGDSTPGSALRIEVRNIQSWHAELTGKNYKYARPGLERSFGCDEIRLTDPFGNRLTFYERIVEAD
jgi:uncharacterized glyoxalase superfamily protein PhnB